MTIFTEVVLSKKKLETVDLSIGAEGSCHKEDTEHVTLASKCLSQAIL